jgi:nitroreductase
MKERKNMNFIDLAQKRYSVRSYSDKKVEKEKLDLILKAANLAPTAANKQPQRLIVIQEEEGLRKISKAANTYGAQCVIIVCSDVNQAWTRPFDGKKTVDIDASIVTDHMMLEATDLGLGTVWICYFNPTVLREELNIPDHVEPINILAVGYTNDNADSPNKRNKIRKPTSETVRFEKF